MGCMHAGIQHTSPRQAWGWQITPGHPSSLRVCRAELRQHGPSLPGASEQQEKELCGEDSSHLNAAIMDRDAVPARQSSRLPLRPVRDEEVPKRE